jgi:formate dehydrogenase accessory protein FdhD
MSESASATPATVAAEPAQRLADGRVVAFTEQVATEWPVALFFNGHSHVVMLATPADLEDFALGFALSEGIVRQPEELTLRELRHVPQGVEIELAIPELRMALLGNRERSMAGRTGCGLCGASTLDAAVRPVRRIGAVAPVVRASQLHEWFQQLASSQPLNHATGAVHGAAIAGSGGEFLVREDVGRHNAVDKVIGAAARAGVRPQALLVTSRASYEIVHKAAEVGCAVVAAISAPTALAIHLAREAGVTLVAWARQPRLTVFSGEVLP